MTPVREASGRSPSTRRLLIVESLLVAVLVVICAAAWPLAVERAEAASTGVVLAWGLDNAPPPGSDFTAVAAGADHSLGLRADGSIAGWGSNFYGQATPPPGTNFQAIAAGWWHSLALRTDGSIAGWGDNAQLQASPPPGNDFVAIAAGGLHSLALKSDGTVVGWGNNNWGQAGSPSGSDYTAIAAGQYHSVALHEDGSITAWGDDALGKTAVPPGQGHTAIAAGGSHNLALRSDGSIVAWGFNSDGQASPPPGLNYKAIAAGEYHSLAIRADGSLAGWGYDDHGQATPPGGTGYLAIAAGASHSLALVPDTTPPDTGVTNGPTGVIDSNDVSFSFTATEAGSTFECSLEPGGAWQTCTSPRAYVDVPDGAHTFWVRATDPAGNTDTTPASRAFSVDTQPPETQIDFAPRPITTSNDAVIRFSSSEPGSTFECRWGLSGSWTACASPRTYNDLAEGSYSFQVRATDALGHLDTSAATVSFTVEAPEAGSIVAFGQSWSARPAGDDFVAIAAGGYHQLALRSDGTVVGWGSNTYGQSTPPAGNDYVAIAAAYRHSLALRSDGTIAAWGRNEYGEGAAPPGNDFVAITAGEHYSAALRYDGTIFAWGQVPSLPAGSDFTAISAKSVLGLALAADGTIVAWPPGVTVPPGPGHTAIAAGGGHALALTADGGVEAWGGNPYGQATAPPGTGYTAVAAGYYHSLALTADGAVLAWGQDNNGQSTEPGGTGYFAISGGLEQSLALVHDNTPPDTGIASGPPATTSAHIFEIVASSPEPWVFFQWKPDGGADWLPANAHPINAGELEDGSYTFQVRAVDQAGNVDPTPASHHFVIDSTGPETVIANPPAWFTNQTDFEWSFSAPAEPAVGFECGLIEAPGEQELPTTWEPCSSPVTYTGLSDKRWVFAVRAIDALGNRTRPAAAHFNIDTVAPQTQLQGPQPLPNPASRAFQLSSDSEGARYECSLDGAPFTPCGPVNETGPLANGQHTFAARAIDPAGNQDQTAATATFTIDVQPTPTPTPTPQPPQTIRGDQAFVLGTSTDLYLACTTLDLYLVDVLPAGRKVAVTGAADLRLAGRPVEILLDGKRVGTAAIGPKGTFSATVKAPAAKRRAKARYQARAGTTRSQNLKLERRMVAATLTRSGNLLTLTGRITKPFAKRPATIGVQRYSSCARKDAVALTKQARPGRSGRFSVTFPVAQGTAKALMYRATTKVATRRGGAARVTTYTLPRAVDLG